ncbi:MAG: sulfurtransferase TusA family protein, partial [Eubacteriales bacterium]|nr:sulfurtransferase TusA family protein [Eubacteriales bacterium]
MKEINAVGQTCPLPVIESKKLLSAHPDEGLMVRVDNEEAVINLSKLAEKERRSFQVRQDKKEYVVEFGPSFTLEESVEVEGFDAGDESRDFIVAFDSEKMGDGDPEFSKRLLRNFIYALSEGE